MVSWLSVSSSWFLGSWLQSKAKAKAKAKGKGKAKANAKGKAKEKVKTLRNRIGVLTYPMWARR